MINRTQIQAFTSTFPNLQGLRLLPISLGLLMIILWSELQDSPSRDLSLPLLIIFSMALFFWFVDRYYQLTYGAVRQTGGTRTREALVSILAGILALACFVFETAFNPLFSPLGILLALSLAFDGLRIKRALPGRVFPLFWIFAAILGWASIFSLLGSGRWWESAGFHTLTSAVLALAALLMFISGLFWHFTLARNTQAAG